MCILVLGYQLFILLKYNSSLIKDNIMFLFVVPQHKMRLKGTGLRSHHHKNNNYGKSKNLS